MPGLPLAAVFADLTDPRRDTENKLHSLTDVLTLATCAVIGGAESWDGIAVFGRAKEAFFRRFLELANGVPSPDTFERVFAKLDPKAFAAAFGRWPRAGTVTVGVRGVWLAGSAAGGGCPPVRASRWIATRGGAPDDRHPARLDDDDQ